MQPEELETQSAEDRKIQTATKQNKYGNRKSSSIWWIHNETCYHLTLSITATRSCPHPPNIISGIMVKIFTRHKE